MHEPEIRLDESRWRDGRDAHELIGCLIFKMASHFSNGLYTLVVTNPYGNDSKSVNATILEPPGRCSARVGRRIMGLHLKRYVNH